MSVVMEQHRRWKGANARLMGTGAPPPKLICPCCGQEVETTGSSAARALAFVKLSPACRKLVNMLTAAYPKPVLGADIANVLWYGMPRPPLTRNRVLAVYRANINKVVRPYGWELQGAYLDAGSTRLVKVRGA